MSNIRMNLLKNYLPNTYVEYGLVLWLDAIVGVEQSDSGLLWRDLSNQNNIVTLINAERTKDSVKFGGNAYGYIQNPSPLTVNTLRGLKERTLEIVCRLNNKSQIHTVFLGLGDASNVATAAAGLWFRPASGGFKVSTYTNVPAITVPTLKRESYSISFENNDVNLFSMLHSGEKVINGASRAGNMHNSTYITIGARYAGSWSYLMNGEVCSIRVYDRKLTNEERVRNLAVDRKRFIF